MHSAFMHTPRLQVLQRLPAALQARVGTLLYEELDRSLLHPALPSCILTSFLTDFSSESLVFGSLSTPQLQRLSRDAIRFPSVLELQIGCQDALRKATCAIDSPGASLCQLFACMPALQHLSLNVRVAADVFFGWHVPLPASLRELDLELCVLEHYTGERIQSSFKSQFRGLQSVLGHLSGLTELERLALPKPGDSDERNRALSAKLREVLPEEWVERGVSVTMCT